jgi:Peptidase family M48
MATMRNTTIISALLVCTPAWAQLGQLKDAISKGVKPPTQAPVTQSEEAVVEENEGSVQSYLEMRAFAEGLYHQIQGTGDNRRASDFKRKVDTAYEEVRKSDMQRAYDMNLSAKSEVEQVIEDRFRVYSGLYDNPIVQTLTNLVGQSIVPQQVSRIYTFKLVADPVPWAESLSTGTIWVSTGLVAMLDSKAQLTYVLAHEAAHVFLNHHRQRLLLQAAQQEYNDELKQNNENRKKNLTFLPDAQKLMLFTPGIGSALTQVTGQNPLVGTGLSALAGGQNPLLGTGLSALAAGQNPLLGTALSALRGGAQAAKPTAVSHTEWNRFEEDEADRMAFEWLLQANIDVRQIPKVYQVLRDAGDRDPRVTLGFLGRSDHVRERLKALQDRLEFEQKQPGWANRVWQTSDENFELLLAEVKRDNGIYALHHDMLETALENLRSAATTRTQDPTALYFYAKALAETARTDDERKEADKYFLQAEQYDLRNENYGSHLHRAVMLLTKHDANAADKKQAVEFLKRYLLGYHFAAVEAENERQNSYPPNLESVYDYMARAGEFRWELDEKSIANAAKARAQRIPLVSYEDPDDAVSTPTSPLVTKNPAATPAPTQKPRTSSGGPAPAPNTQGTQAPAAKKQ